MLLKYSIYLLLCIVFLGFMVILWQMRSYKVPEPSYKRISVNGAIEIREYPELLTAQVEMKGERIEAIRAGFRVLAHYIFGGNHTKQKIAMTAPVIQHGININMTAPVMQEQKNSVWIVRFMMPAGFTLQMLPKPDDPAVTLVVIPAKKYAVIRFSGLNNDDNINEHKKLLLDYISKNNLVMVGEPVLAFYNPPWILPFLRRNEIMIEIKS